MKLYDFGQAPNPRRVRIFLAEKGIKVPTEQVDIGEGKIPPDDKHARPAAPTQRLGRY